MRSERNHVRLWARSVFTQNASCAVAREPSLDVEDAARIHVRGRSARLILRV